MPTSGQAALRQPPYSGRLTLLCPSNHLRETTLRDVAAHGGCLLEITSNAAPCSNTLPEAALLTMPKSSCRTITSQAYPGLSGASLHLKLAQGPFVGHIAQGGPLRPIHRRNPLWHWQDERPGAMSAGVAAVGSPKNRVGADALVDALRGAEQSASGQAAI